MARIAGVDLPGKKRIEVALTYLHGVGLAMANRILEKVGIDRNSKTEQLTISKWPRSEKKSIRTQG
jgi:small subunit ribosomal protein S13